MNTNFIVTFAIGIVVYLIGLGIFTLIKSIINKRRFKKEVKEHEQPINESKVKDIEK